MVDHIGLNQIGIFKLWEGSQRLQLLIFEELIFHLTHLNNISQSNLFGQSSIFILRILRHMSKKPEKVDV